MLSTLLRRQWLLVLVVAGMALAVLAAVLLIRGDRGTGPAAQAGPAEEVAKPPATQLAPKLVVYNGRSHYGDEKVFKDFEAATGVKVELRGGTGPELFERLKREGADTPADLLITTDLANLWRAESAGLLRGVTSETLRGQVPDALRDPAGQWWAVSTRVRVPMVSTQRVPAGAVDSYDDLADPRFKGRTCLRTSNSEYNQSLVADMIAKRGPQATEALLRSWIANEPKIIGSDGQMLGMLAGGECDLGLANHYYLARALRKDPAFPVAPAWPDQAAAGAHANVSGMGVVASSESVPTAVALMEWLTAAPAQQQIIAEGEFAANPSVPPAPFIKDWASVKTDPIDAEKTGPLLDDAVAMMLAVGWR